jgi:hypothetical protein
MPVGAGGEALRRIEAALAADDPALVESFRRWREPPGDEPSDGGVASARGWTAWVLLFGLMAIAVESSGALMLLVLGLLLVLCAHRPR